MEFDPNYLALIQQLTQGLPGNAQSFYFPGLFPGLSMGEIDPESYGQAYVQEALKLQLTAALRHSQMTNQIADYASIMDPKNVPLGAAIEVMNTEETFPYVVIDGEEEVIMNVSAETLIDLDAFQLFFAGNNPQRAGLENRLFYLKNPVTGNGFLIDGDMLQVFVEGEKTASVSLQELFQIEGSGTGTIHLPNGIKLTLIFKEVQGEGDEDGAAILDRILITHPDGSFADLGNFNGPPNKLSFEHGQKSPDIITFMDESIQDGFSLFMGPEGASLHYLDPETTEFSGIFGDERALNLGLQAASFGGNYINFYYSTEFQSWFAQNLLFKPGEEIPEGLQFSFPQNWNPIPGLQLPPGILDPSKIPGIDSIEDLIFEDLTGLDPTGNLEQAKSIFLKEKLRHGRVPFQTKLFILLYLFINKNNKEVDEIFVKLAGVTSDNLTGDQPQSQYTIDNIDQAPLKYQIDFWSKYRPPDLSDDPFLAQQQLAENATMVNGKIKGLELDSTLLQAQLTNLIRDRNKFIDTIVNCDKVLHDALANAIRRIV